MNVTIDEDRGPAGESTDWVALTRRVARSVQTTIGWIFWDPGAVARYEDLGLAGPLGYIAARAAPFAGAGPDAVAAAFGSISPLGIAVVFDQLSSPEAFLAVWEARNEAVVEGLREHAPGIVKPLIAVADDLWVVVGELPTVGRPFSASHRGLPRPADPLLSGWHAVNHLREWRGDTHWAIVAAQGLSADEASILHNEWLGYDDDWLSRSRGNSPGSIVAAWRSLTVKGLAEGEQATAEGLALRQWIEDETDRRTTLPWELYGRERTVALVEQLEPPCELLLARVDFTAGDRYQPASRVRPDRPG